MPMFFVELYKIETHNFAWCVCFGGDLLSFLFFNKNGIQKDLQNTVFIHIWFTKL